MSHSVIKPEEFDENVFHLIDKDWFLMTAEHDGVVNPMTVAHEGETPYFTEARLAFICRKLCVSQLGEGDFLGNSEFTSKWYGGENRADGSGGDYHHLYIAEIEKILKRDAE